MRSNSFIALAQALRLQSATNSTTNQPKKKKNNVNFQWTFFSKSNCESISKCTGKTSNWYDHSHGKAIPMILIFIIYQKQYKFCASQFDSGGDETHTHTHTRPANQSSAPATHKIFPLFLFYSVWPIVYGCARLGWMGHKSDYVIYCTITIVK